MNTRSCYVSRRKKTIMKNRYLKFTFKNERSTVNVWKNITLDKKNSLHVLTKRRKMNLDIYINKILKSLKLSFFKRCFVTNQAMIWMNDEATYHISKKIITWKQLHDLKRMNWSIQSFNLNLIKNLWRIIKIRVNVRRHQIYNFEAMKRTIIEKWKLLTKKNYKRCIENMSRRIQLVIQTKDDSIKYWNYILIFDQLIMKFQRFNASCCILIIWGEFQ